MIIAHKREIFKKWIGKKQACSFAYQISFHVEIVYAVTNYSHKFNISLLSEST